MWEVREMKGVLSRRPTWQGLFLQSCCISSIHGGQMWEVREMKGVLSHRPTWQGLLLQSCCISPIHGWSDVGSSEKSGSEFLPWTYVLHALFNTCSKLTS